MMPKDWDLKLIDMNVEPLTDADLKWADTVFIGAMVVQKESVRDVINRSKKFDKNVVAGGPLFSSTPEEFPEIDTQILNEAEITLPFYLEDLSKGSVQKIYRSDEKPDIAQTPLPKWNLINMSYYACMSIQYSRGCPFDCEFCDIVHLNGRKPPRQIQRANAS